MPPKKPAEEVPAEPAPPTSGTGKFYFKNGGTYVGDWILLFPQPPPTPEGGEKKAPPKKKDDAPAVPVEPPRRVRHGKGTYTEGDYTYQGEFHEDVIQGSGKLTYASGAFYQGQWVNGLYEGLGKYVWPDGRSYEGEWTNNRMHGTGTYIDINGHRNSSAWTTANTWELLLRLGHQHVHVELAFSIPHVCHITRAQHLLVLSGRTQANRRELHEGKTEDSDYIQPTASNRSSHRNPPQC